MLKLTDYQGKKDLILQIAVVELFTFKLKNKLGS